MQPNAPSWLRQTAEVIRGTTRPAPGLTGERYVGVDLGTAKLVLLVLDSAGLPLAGRLQPAQVVRDGLVVDFIGAVDRLRAMKAEVEAELGRELTVAFSGFPPGVPAAEVRATAHVVEAAGMECLELIDEPSAANLVLGVREGAIVDVGGGTTGVAVIRNGEVVHSADEATGGTHFNLVIAGAFDIPYEVAEQRKHDPDQQERLLPLVRPVMEKIATITARQIERYSVERIFLVGGACAYPGMAAVVEERLGLPVQLAPEPQLVTPLGIARAHMQTAKRESGEAALEMDTVHG